MGLIDRLFKRNKPPISSSETQAFSGRMPFTTGMSDEQIIDNPTVVACINLISSIISMFPIELYFKNPATGSRTKAGWHPLYQILKYEPNPEETPAILINRLMRNLLQYGNVFIFRDYDSSGVIQALYLLDPRCITVKRDPVTNRKNFIYYSAQGAITYTSEQILHIPGMFYDGTIGHSPARYARSAIELGISMDQYAKTAFEEGVNTKMIVDTSEMNSSGPILPEEAEKWRGYIHRQWSGRENAGKPIVSLKGMKLIPVELTSNHDAQLVESRTQQERELAKIFNVSIKMLTGENTTFEQRMAFVTMTLMPWMRIVTTYLGKLLTSRERLGGAYYFEMDTDAILKADILTRYDAYGKAVQFGFKNINEIRANENEDKCADESTGQTYWIMNTLRPNNKETNDAYMASAKVKIQGNGEPKTGQNTTANGDEPNLDSNAK